MKVDIHYWVMIAGIVAFAGIVFFVLSIVLAASSFPGGYEWDRHFLSDLGRLETKAGESNWKSSLRFNGGVIVLAICVLPFFVLAPLRLKKLGGFALVCGVLSICGLFGIGLTPYDKYFVLHHVALVLWIGPMLMAMIAFLMSWIEQGRSPYVIFLVTGFVLLPCAIYTLGIDRSWVVICQKALAASSALWVLVVTLLVSFTVRDSISARNQLADEQAVRYMSRLERGHRKRR